MKILIKILLILILISAAGCRGEKTQGKEASASGNKAEKESVKEDESAAGNNSDNYGGKGDRIKKVEISTSEKKTVKTVKNIINTDENMVNSYFLLSEISGKKSIDPEDFEIGSLYSGDKQFSDVSDLINDFFSELKNNKVKKRSYQ